MRAITLVIANNAEIVEEYAENSIRTSSKIYKMPSVIRQFSKFKRTGDIQFSRINVYLRDNWTCQYCGDRKNTKELTFDHVVPRSQGGKTSWTNIVTSCRPCNVAKSDQTPEQVGYVMLNKPIKPKWLPAQIILKMKNIPEQWIPYIDPSSLIYWTYQVNKQT